MRIIMDGVIRPATACIPANERPIVWFSTHPHWEPTATKAIRFGDRTIRKATFEEMARLAGGRARIGVASETAQQNTMI